MPFPSFCSGSVAKYEGKFCEGAGKDTVFVFHPAYLDTTLKQNLLGS